MKRALLFVVLVGVLFGALHAASYVLLGPRWETPTVTFWVDIPGEDGLWNAAFEDAMAAWNEDAGFDYQIVRGEYRDPCVDNGEGVNGVKFATTVCGDEFGSSTLAVTRSSYRTGSLLNPDEIFVQTGIIFDANRSWTVYSGPLDFWTSSEEFRRVAVHELGHALGLGHETSNAAIMQPTVGDIERPTADDIAGVRALYPQLEPSCTDTDGDGVCDEEDNCPAVSNADQANYDDDSEGDVCDADDDNDEVPDTEDAFPFDANESVDTDGDGIGNNADPDDDNDGFTDAQEAEAGTDPLDAESKPGVDYGGLVAHYPFSGNADDESGNGNDGVVHGATLTTDRFGNEDSAYLFDGGFDRIEISPVFSGDQDPLTFSAWVKVEEFGGTIYGEFTNSGQTRNFFKSYAGGLVFDQYFPSGGGVNVDVGLGNHLQQWAHIALIKESDGVSGYLNGVLIGSANHSETYSGPSSTMAALGNRFNAFNGGWADQDFDGSIDDVRIYNRALSAAEVAGLYQQSDSTCNASTDASGLFESRTTHGVDYYPMDVALGDINNDGNEDAVVTSDINNFFRVLLGQGDGSFSSQSTYGTEQRPESIALGDLNNDGNLDAVTTGDDGPDSVSVLLGHGNGSFASRSTYGVGPDPKTVTLADLDDDGALDVLTSNGGDSTVSVLLGQGNGSFALAVSYAGGGSIAAGDLDGDGVLDLVSNYACDTPATAKQWSGNGHWYDLIGNGLGGSDQLYTWPDAKADAEARGGYLATTTSAEEWAFLKSQMSTWQPETVWPNGGGTYQGWIGAFQNTSSPSYSEPGGGWEWVTGEPFSYTAWRAGEPNNSGGEDYVLTWFHAAEGWGDFVNYGESRYYIEYDSLPACEAGSQTIGVRLGQGDGTFGGATSYMGSGAVALGDIDGDGALDVVVSNESAQTVSVLRGVGDGTLEEATTSSSNGGRIAPLADLNGDGVLDVAVGYYNASTSLTALLGQCDGSLGSQGDYDIGSQPRSLTLGDLNGDGAPDLAAPNYGSHTISVLLGVPASCTDTDGDGVCDEEDNCPAVSNADQANYDGDTEGDVCDADDDNDEVPDTEDAFPFDASESVDTDGDGIGNNADPDDDNDGFTDAQEAEAGTDPLDAESTPGIDNGLVAHYPFSGNADDASGNGNHATEYGGVQSGNYVDGVDGEALYLDGSGQYLETETMTDSWSHWSVVFFAKPSPISEGSFDQAIILEREIGGHQQDLEVGISVRGRVYVEADSASETWLETAGTLAANFWNHGAVTYDGSEIRFYLDGELDSVIAQSGAHVDLNTPIKIGKHANPNAPLYYRGSLDEIRIYDRAISAEEVAELYSDPNDGLVAHYPFSGNADDASGSGNHGVVEGATLTADRFGNPNSAYLFDGVDDYIDLGLGIDADFSALTVSAWVSGVFGPIFTRGEHSLNDVGHIELDFNGWFQAITTGQSFDFVYDQLPLSQWALVTAVWDGTTARVYVNGVDTGITEQSTGELPFNGLESKIGLRPKPSAHRYFDGSIDDVRIYNRALSAEEVADLYFLNPVEDWTVEQTPADLILGHTPTPTAWSVVEVEGEQAIYSGDDPNGSLVSDFIASGDFVFTGQFSALDNGDSDLLGLVFDWQSHEQTHFVAWGGHEVARWNGHYHISRRDGDSDSDLVKVQSNWTPTRWYDFSVEKTGSTYRIRILSDGSVAHDHTFTDETFSSGRVGIHSTSQSVYFRRLSFSGETVVHSENVCNQGEIVSWGRDNGGQVSDTPTGDTFVSIAGGGAHSLALTADGSIISWGYDDRGQVSDTPTGSGFIAIAAGTTVYDGGGHSLALTADGSIVSWGNDDYGQVSNTPSGTGFTAIAAGRERGMALAADGSIVSWGNDLESVVSDTPTGSGFTAIGAGEHHSLALAADGSIVSWGRNAYGEVSGTPGGSGFVAIAAGGYHSMALAADGSIVAWARNSNGQVSNTPTEAGFIAIAAGVYHGLALAADGSILSWGNDVNGQVGETPGGTGFTAIAAGVFHSLALHRAGSVADVCDAGDADGDGVPDTSDNCPAVSNADQANYDGDTEGDVCDSDDDNDGVPDTEDAFPFDSSESVDTDGDGIGNNADLDDDNDRFTDAQEAEAGTDPLDAESTPGIDYGLVAHYPFSGNADDASGSGNHGVVEGATLTADRFGNANSAYSFDGVDDYIFVTPNLGGLTEFTKTLWLAPRALIYGSLFRTPNGGIGYDSGISKLSLDVIGDRQGGMLSNPYSYDVHSATPFSFVTDRWTHVAFVGNADNSASLYIDGVEISFSSSIHRGGVTGKLNGTIIGATYKSNETPQFESFADAVIDDLYLYNRALSAEEVAALADGDGDGIVDGADNCPMLADADQTDTDGDGAGDMCDPDDDGDGWTDVDEAECGTEPLVDTSTPVDTDGDGSCNALDLDDDNDTWSDAYEAACGADPLSGSSQPVDTDGDAVCNGLDSDDDDDGWTDAEEAACGTESLLDTSIPVDTDGDTSCDVVDLDDDGDGWTDVDEAECGTESLLDTSIPVDTDGDASCDVVDLDDDGDGWTDVDEAECGTESLLDTSIPVDTDGDTSCNALDLDDDGDGWFDNYEAVCGTDPLVDTSAPLDTDGDESCNALDEDDDNDETLDADDAFPLDATEDTDTDGDGTGDNADTDDDGDSWSDMDEVACGTEALNSESVPTDTDGDESCNALDEDDDNDGHSDADEIVAGTDPLNAESFPIPEPSSGLLALTALLTLAGLRRRRVV